MGSMIYDEYGFIIRPAFGLVSVPVTPSNFGYDPNSSLPGRAPPVFVAPMMLPHQIPAKRRSRVWGVLWTVLGFVAGVATGPLLTRFAPGHLERAYAVFGMTPLRIAQSVTPSTPTQTLGSAAPESENLPGMGAVPVVSPLPSGEVAPVGDRRRGAAPGSGQARVLGSRSSRTANSERSQVAGGGPASHGSAAESAASPEAAEIGEERPTEAKGTKLVPKSQPDFDDSKPAAKVESARKPAASSSPESLDNLMADVVTDKGEKKRDNKSIDALLKDVQKSNPEAQKRDEQAPLASLSQSDISKVMAGVRAGGKDCARSLGQSGVAELKVTVGKGGDVTDLRLGGNLAHTPVAECIEKLMRAATFPPSSGLRFDYRLDVR